MTASDIMKSEIFNWCVIISTFAGIASLIFIATKQGRLVLKNAIKALRKRDINKPIKYILLIIVLIILMVFFPIFCIIFSFLLSIWKFWVLLFFGIYILVMFLFAVFFMFSMVTTVMNDLTESLENKYKAKK